jgi:hypothetical protein
MLLIIFSIMFFDKWGVESANMGIGRKEEGLIEMLEFDQCTA